MASKSSPLQGILQPRWWVYLPLLALVLSVLFVRSFPPGSTLFSNDGPLGSLMSDSHRVPEVFSGGWQDLNTLGFREGGAFPSITYGLLWLLGPVGFSTFYAPLTLLILGMGAFAFFRQSGLTPLACVLGATAAALNSAFLSTSAWGVGSHPLALAMNFFALAALTDSASSKQWLRVGLGGLCVGMGVMEGADVGAIFSVFVAAFVMYQSILREGTPPKQIVRGAIRVTLVALFAGFMAFHAIQVLVGTQVAGVSGMQQDSRTKQERWDWATQWSLPKREALGFVVPGLFGYRMDTPDGGNYWGAVGRDPSWDRYFAQGKQGQPPQGFMRFTGGGIYAGILVALVGLWAVLQGLKKKDSVFPLPTRKWLWFWSAILLVSLLLAFGRFAPFYQILYALPYFSTIRNPAKFVHVFNWALVVLFAYGVHGLWNRYMDSAEAAARFDFKGWWRQVKGFDKRWTLGCLAALGASLLGWMITDQARRSSFATSRKCSSGLIWPPPLPLSARGRSPGFWCPSRLRLRW